MQHESASSAREAGITYHLVPVDYWATNGKLASYTPEAFEQDGFIHCTNGTDELLTVANMFYTSDPREFTVLVLNVDSIESDVRYDDANEVYPHIYGPLNTSAVVGQLQVERDENGKFIRIGSPVS